jgi:hypothetical protein
MDWDNTAKDVDVLYTGLKIGKYVASDVQALMNYHNGLGTPNGFMSAGMIRKIADMGGITSAGIDTETKYILDHVTMWSGTHLPRMYTYWVDQVEWLSAHRYGMGNLYKFAKNNNYQLAKWNNTLAWQELKACMEIIRPQLSNGYVPLFINPTNNTYSYDSGRFYDEHAEWLEWYLVMYEVDRDANLGALTYARDTIWEFVNVNNWSIDHYIYSPQTPNWECEGGFFPLIFCRLMALNGYGLSHWDRVLQDMKKRFLDSLWSSPQWVVSGTSMYCVIHHNPANPEHRLGNTLGAWVCLEAFYQLLDVTSQSNMLSMLDGSVKAWEHLLNNSSLYDAGTKKFREVDGASVTDYATAHGIITLFLLGIVPQTGALYSPIHEWMYECVYALDDYFNFNYTDRKIKIPVMHGDIKFIYGSSPVTHTFTEDGVYELTFASDWNSITTATKVGTLDPLKTYVRQIGAPLVQKSTTLTLQLTKS